MPIVEAKATLPFLNELQQSIKGDVLSDELSLGMYSTDASFYQIKPLVVVLPMDEADVKKAVDELSGEFAARLFGKSWDRVDRRGLAFMQANGVTVTKADAGLVKSINDKVAPLVDNWVKAAEAKGMTDARKSLGEFRAEIAKLK